jgi:transcriptional regulator with XRE-family HTH domain
MPFSFFVLLFKIIIRNLKPRFTTQIHPTITEISLLSIHDITYISVLSSVNYEYLCNFKNMGFRENLKQELSYNGMLVKELSTKSGVHKRALDTYLREKASIPPADTAVQIARALGVSVEYLVTGKEAGLPRDIRVLTRNLLKLEEKDRKVVSALVRALLDKRENS